MNKQLRGGPARWLLVWGGLALAGCGQAGEASKTAKSAPATSVDKASFPSVLEVVRHYAELTAQNPQLKTPASQRYGEVLPQTHPARNSFSIYLPACDVEVLLDKQQRIDYISITSSQPQEQTDRSQPAVGRLLRLGTVRQAFGPGNPIDRPQTLAVWSRRYPVAFRYQPQAGRPVRVEAVMPQPVFADSATVHTIYIHPATQPPEPAAAH